ncbi:MULTISPECIES: DUF1349 domain-containing protein [Paenibacillus]|uniref:DUF1349 domain-containing protein n=1 Tax=Paenibacillus TaxID=44249 RepID=UPI0022B87DA4|nr:DUF1349 domain-containing protein [Paenibacillus caseinilyticus]MCZ8517879.1 DUF1349 domain-containing protein [Paenibacillus caseinilyticus]
MTTETVLYEKFDAEELHPGLQWHSPPQEWSIRGSKKALVVKPGAQTDFWQKTHYGFKVDNGHFLYTQARGDVVLTTKVRSYPVHQFDQAGLMVRFSETCWLKTSVEYDTQGESKLGVVVTNHGYSDWSTQNFKSGFTELLFRIRREAGDYLVEFSEVPQTQTAVPSWTQLRMAHLAEDLHDDTPFQCGLYACSPQGSGFTAEFEELHLKQGRVSGS